MHSLQDINNIVVQRHFDIESWFAEKSSKIEVPLYTSVDIRISNNKIAPVDTNIFPAGFNNLSADCRLHSAELFKNFFASSYREVNKIMIIPELHTRNPYYWENIYVLKAILKSVGFEVGIGLIGDELRDNEYEFETLSSSNITAYKLIRNGSKVHTTEMAPDLLMLNNDLSTKFPEILREVSQPIQPPVELGWHTRRKNIHFDYYNSLAEELAELLDIDPIAFSIETELVGGVNFDDVQDRARVADVVDNMIADLRHNYKLKGIDEEPYVIVKSNYGTYGMAVISITHGDDVRNMNAAGRKTMRVSKGGVPVRDVVVQEGIPTSLTIGNDVVTEPVVYLIDTDIAGAFLRLNKGKGRTDNLNARGMEFSTIECIYSLEGEKYFPSSARMISRAASLAAGCEIEAILNDLKQKQKVS